jgi:hypothetical protein
MRTETVSRPAKDLPVPGEVFTVAGCEAFLISPSHTAAAGRARPWVWYAPTLPGLPGTEERWMFQKFVDAGMAMAGIDVGESTTSTVTAMRWCRAKGTRANWRVATGNWVDR